MSRVQEMKIINTYEHLFSNDLLKTDLKERSVRGGIITMICQVAETVIRIGSIAILARLLVPEYFGLISMVTALTVVAERLKDFGLSSATVQQKNLTHEQVSNLFWINTGIGFVLMLIIASLAILIAKFYAEPRLAGITIAISFRFLIGGMTVQHQALLHRQMKFTAMGTISLTASVASTVIAIVLAVNGYGYWALVWRELSNGLFIALGTWIGCPWIPGLPNKSGSIRDMLNFGKHIAGFNVLVYFAANMDQVLIGKFFGPIQVGLYRQAYTLISMPVMQFVDPVNRVARPALSALQDEAESIKKYYKKILTMTNFFTMPLVLFLAVFAREVILVVVGEKWIDSVELFRILALSFFVVPASDSTGILLITTGRARKYFDLGVMTAIILVFSFSVGSLWGAPGVAYAYLIARALLLVLRLHYSFEGTVINVRIFYKAIERPLVASLAMTLVLVGLKSALVIHNNFLMLGLCMPIAILVYLATWMLMSGGRSELRQILLDVLAPVLSERHLSLLGIRKKGIQAA